MTMTVLHVVESMRPEAGSVTVSLRGLFPALARRDITSRIVTSDAAMTNGTTDPTVSALDPRTSPRLVDEADVVHVHGWGYDAARTIAAAARRAKTPYVLSPGGALTHSPYRPRGWRDRVRGLFGADSALPRAASVVTALNTNEEHDLRAEFDHPRIERLAHGLTFSEYATNAISDSAEPPPGDCRELLVLGPLAPIEGCVPLLKAVAELGDEADGWSVVFAGRDVGDWRSMLEAAVQRKGGAGRVTFADAPDVAAQRAWLARAAAVACPALHPRVGVSILQAIASGVAAVSATTAAPDGINGAIQVYPPGRARLREALRAVFGMDDAERAGLTGLARGDGAARFDWSVLVEDYARLYRSLA
jgi:glycosyltransferase involved in cell wall biosynthesis